MPCSTGEFKIHNVKFYDLEPRAIHSLAFDHDGTKKYLALSRSDGSIEIWDLEYTPHIVQILDGGTGESVESLAWSKGRLFSTGLQGYVNEFDLETLAIKHKEPVVAGPSWCLEANRAGTYLAIGTENGQVCLMSLKKNTLVSTKTLDRQEGRILCVSWHNSGEFVVTGSVDNLRVWNVESGHCINRIMVGRAHKAQETIVWCAAILSDFTVVSGDSRGKVCFWNGHLGTSIMQVQSHKADVLCLCLTSGEQTIYASGVDSAIVSFERVESQGRTKWVKSSSRNVHTHDVRGITVTSRFLISGGVDTYLNMSYFPPKLLWKYPPVPQYPCATVAPGARSILLRYTTWLELWRLGEAVELDSNDRALSLQPTKLLRLNSKRQERISCAAVSDDASIIAFSTPTSVRAFKFTFLEGEPFLSKLNCSFDVEPSYSMSFIHTPSGYLLASSTRETIQILNITAEGGMVVQREIKRPNSTAMVHLMCSSDDGSFLAAADVLGDITVYSVQKDFEEQCRLPMYKCKATAMSIHPTTHCLVAVYCDHQIVEYHLGKMEYTKWGKQLLGELPPQWESRMNCVTGVSFDVRNKDIIFLQDDSAITVIDKSVSLEPGAKIPRLYDTSDSNSEKSSMYSSAFTYCKRYKHLVHLARLSPEELVTVEVTPLSLAERLPPTLHQKKFGV